MKCHYILLFITLLLLPSMMAMHKKSKKVVITQEDTGFSESNKKLTTISMQGAEARCIIQRWKGKEQFACKCIVSSLLDRTIKHCFAEEGKLGTFNGGDKSVITYCEGNQSFIVSYKDFVHLILPDDPHSILFIINECLYDIEGNTMVTGYEKRYDKKKSLITTMGRLNMMPLLPTLFKYLTQK